MQEMWINNKVDWKEFLSFIQEENIIPVVTGEENDEYIVQAGEFVVHIPFEYELPKFQAPTVKSDKYDSLIFGKDGTEKIVNVTVDNDQVFIYKADGSVDVREYLNWAIGSIWDEGCSRLKGNQFFKFIKDLPEDQYYGLKDNWNPRIWTPRTATEGFLLRSGMTYFKGMKVSDVSLMSFDIEATTLDKDNPDAEVVLLSITCRDRRGRFFKHLFDMFDYQTRQDMWTDIAKHVKRLDPDIIIGHNILPYDLPYANKDAGGLNWGRDGSAMTFDTKASKIRKDGSQQYEFFNAQISGREIVDTFFLSLKYDIGREFPSYGLKAIEKHLGLVEEDRSWDFAKWPVRKLVEAKKAGNDAIWNEFRQYCEDDSDSPIKMFDIMIPSFFYLCQSVPKSLQQMINEASGSQLDSLMIRSYLQDNMSLPKTSKKEEFEGAVSMGVPGVYKNVRKVDVASLYPSIMLQYEIYDKKKDPSRNMLKMLEYFRNERLTNKRLAKETGDKYYDDLQNSQKIMINSMYGFMGAGYLLFNYPEGAAEVTKRGREILLKGVEWATGHTLEKVVKSTRNKGTDDEEDKFHWIVGRKISEGLNYTLVNTDTDSFSYTNGLAPSKEEFKKEIESLNSIYPELIKWEDDGVYERIVVVKAKNYVLVKNGKVKYKGSSLTDQKKEPRLLTLLEQLINVLLTEDNKEEAEAKILAVYNECCREVVAKFNVLDWVTKKTVTKSILNPKRANEQKPMDAINEAIKRGVITGTQEGDKIWLYLAIDGERPKVAKGEVVTAKKTGAVKMIENDVYRYPELWDGKDQHTKHYLERIFSTTVILENIIDITKFPKYYSPKMSKEMEDLKILGTGVVTAIDVKKRTFTITSETE